ncbi:patatin-like phospholipase family protein [Terriglobus sp. RCC_193]|uniref:patatin-like phospholipase family protein n=1 Tax=Terriglobus sp. RCC_193 TaxID=3239218 RepID=UPI003524EDA9
MAPASGGGSNQQLAPQQGPPQGALAPPPTGGNGAQGDPFPDLGRKRIGVALGGGGALALSEIGVLRWMEENHIPVDVIAGTSMGSLVGALYATGHTPDQISALTSDRVFSKVFRLDTDFRELNFRRREDQRFLPGGFNLGLKHGPSIRNGVLLDYGLNQFLNAQFLPYGADFSFNNLPLPFRCVATDILVGREAVFTRGPLAEAVRASISIPGVFPPLEDGGHIYVDGALTENLPTDIVKRELHADVVLAVSLPLTPPGAGDTNSLLGILGRSFSVASWSNEVRSRQLADVLIEPIAPPNASSSDYAKAGDLAKAGYAAAQKMAPELLKYRVSDEEWEAYMAHRQHREPRPPQNIASVKVIAPNNRSAIGIRDTVDDLSGKKLETDKVEAKLNEVRSDGRYNTDYFLSKPGQKLDTEVTGPANVGRHVEGRELLHPDEKRGPGDGTLPDMVASSTQPPETAKNTAPSGKPAKEPKQKAVFETVAPSSSGKVAIAVGQKPGYVAGPDDVDLNLVVRDRPGGPPYLLLGGNIISQSGGTNRASLDAIFTQQDLGTYKSEGRLLMRIGRVTQFVPEYYWRPGDHNFFIAPRLQLYRTLEPIWEDQHKVSERLTQAAGGGVDFGYSQSHFTEWRFGYQMTHQLWNLNTGSDGQPDIRGNSQLARLQYSFNSQDRAMVPRHGLRADVSAGYLFDTTNSVNAPRIEASGAYFYDLGHKNTVSLSLEGGTMGNRQVADPFRFTLGGPLRLTASAFDEYRGTDYMLVRPAYFRRIAELPMPLGQSIYVIGTYELGRMYAPDRATLMRQDVFFGLAAETPLGALTFGPSIGDHDHRKFVFTLGRFF